MTAQSNEAPGGLPPKLIASCVLCALLVVAGVTSPLWQDRLTRAIEGKSELTIRVQGLMGHKARVLRRGEVYAELDGTRLEVLVPSDTELRPGDPAFRGEVLHPDGWNAVNLEVRETTIRLVGESDGPIGLEPAVWVVDNRGGRATTLRVGQIQRSVDADRMHACVILVARRRGPVGLFLGEEKLGDTSARSGMLIDAQGGHRYTLKERVYSTFQTEAYGDHGPKRLEGQRTYDIGVWSTPSRVYLLREAPSSIKTDKPFANLVVLEILDAE